MSHAHLALDRLTDHVARSPLAASGVSAGSLASGSAGWVAKAAEAEAVLQLAASVFGLLGAMVGLAVGLISLRKALRKP